MSATDDAIKRWAANAARRASLVAFVKDEEDVILAIKYARDNGSPIAIRGGGHSPSGSSSTEGGVVIDLSRYLNGVTIESEKQLARIDGGALWKTVDETAIKYGLASVAGTINHTGVGGLTLGGGFGWLTSSYGLVIDNLVKVTLVTASGSVITVSENENPDLFFAIRGGGSNFGVVTRFVIKLHPQHHTVYAGHLMYPPPLFESVVKVLKDWWPKAGEREGLMSIHTNGPNGEFVLQDQYMTRQGKFRMRDSMPYKMILRTMDYGVYMKSVAHNGPDFATNKRVLEKVAEMQLKDITCTVIFEYLPQNKVMAVPNDSTAFHRTGKSMIVHRMHEKLANEICGAILGDKSLLNNPSSFGYGNYDGDALLDSDCLNRAEAAFGSANYSKLQRIKNKYDPENIFNKWFPIVPA
ncbi:hypothetical protein F5887DRAFT_1155375 [Amanita rubescens]|nr:hypothetical protein F5887DRAFT_1155375 [Amanita rubescens]